MIFKRCESNPLIKPGDLTPSHEGLRVCGVFNPACCMVGNRTVLLVRVAEMALADPDEIVVPVLGPRQEDSGRLQFLRFSKDTPGLDTSDSRYVRVGRKMWLSGLSHIRLAWSEDGRNFELEDRPFVFPETAEESFGVEDARIVRIEDRWWITYTAVSPHGVCTNLASTTDFLTVHRHGILFPPENKDVCIFPEKIGGRYHVLHRPSNPLFGRHTIWYANSPDLKTWGGHLPIIAPRENGFENERVGGGAPCVKTPDGWLQIYHGANHQHRYSLFAALFDLNDPSKLIARSEHPILEPVTSYERTGFFGEVVFTNGLVLMGDTLRLYYGAADESVCLAEAPVSKVLKTLKPVRWSA